MKKTAKKTSKKKETTEKCQQRKWYPEPTVCVVGRIMDLVLVFAPKKLEKMAVLFVGCEHDYIRVMLMPSLYQSVARTLKQGDFICVRGEISIDKGEQLLIGSKIYNFDTKELKELVDSTPVSLPVVYDKDHYEKLLVNKK